MKNKAFALSQWTFRATDRILPDANFWINVFGPAAAVGNANNQLSVYSRALQLMLQQKVEIFLDVLIMSEFVNAVARMEFNSRFIGTYGSRGFKRFRNSPDFLPIARMISSECRKIYSLSIRTDHSFSQWSTSQLLSDFEQGGVDFNDQLIVEISRKNNFTLLTDDSDMTEGGLQVITANPRLLQACPN